MDNFDKKNVARNIRIAMGREMVSIDELANRTGLSRYQIDNILYNRALPIKSLEKIAKALNMKLPEIISNEASIEPKVFDTEIYSKIMVEISNTFAFYKIHASRHTTEKIANIAYDNFSDIKDLGEAIRGMVLILKESNPDIQKL